MYKNTNTNQFTIQNLSIKGSHILHESRPVFQSLLKICFFYLETDVRTLINIC